MLVTSLVAWAQPIAVAAKTLKFVYAGPKIPKTLHGELLVAAQDAGDIFEKKDCPEDVPCAFQLTMQEPILLYSQDSTRITFKQDVAAIEEATGGDVVVTERIDPNACPDESLGVGRILGCADGYGRWVMITRDTRAIMGVTLAHELGHARGLPHRCILRALMNPVYAPENRALDRWECDQLHNPLTNPLRKESSCEQNKTRRKIGHLER